VARPNDEPGNHYAVHQVAARCARRRRGSSDLQLLEISAASR
jgi:hypothetical protein